MLNRLVKIGCDISKDYVLRKTRYLSGRATSKIPRERRSKNQLMLPISDAKRLKLGNEATNIEKRLERSYDNDRSENEHKVVSAINKNIKYSYAKKFSTLKSCIGQLVDSTDSTVTCPKKMADLLATQYQSVFSEPKQPIEDQSSLFPDERLEKTNDRYIFGRM